MNSRVKEGKSEKEGSELTQKKQFEFLSSGAFVFSQLLLNLHVNPLLLLLLSIHTARHLLLFAVSLLDLSTVKPAVCLTQRYYTMY